MGYRRITMATKKKTKSTPKRVTKKAAKKVSAKKIVKPKVHVPFIATAEGMNALKYHCEGIMDLVGEYIMTGNPKISQKDFAHEAQQMIKIFFGMESKKARK
jgi:hypothetical protein